MKKLKLFSLFFLFTYCTYSQSIGIGTTNPNGSAQVDISSSGKGLLIPRMTTVLINSISNPAKGLMVYDSSNNQLMVNMGSASAPNWQTIVANSGWGLSGNSGTLPAAQFIGTTDNNPLMFRVNSQFAGQIDSAGKQTFLGYGAGVKTSPFVKNSAFGYKALFNNTTGQSNTAFGIESLFSNINASENTAYGYQSLYYNNGIGNVAMGFLTLGYNQTGNHNTAIGSLAMCNNTIGIGNTALGYLAGLGVFTSYYNTSIGYNTGWSHEMGYNNTLVGANCNLSVDGLYNTVAIGQGTIVTASSQARIGNSATNSIGGYANWTNISDGRFKKDIKEDVKGIDFIMKLRPITYYLDVEGISKRLDESRGNELDIFSKQAIAEKERIVFSGFVAQDVEKAAQESSYEFSGVDKPKNEKDFYGLRYAEFVVPLVKAMQEQQTLITDMQKRIVLLEEQNKMLMQLLNKKN